uniref:eukaryotic translation initiation factor 2 subunit beta-like n=1 Tax=Erigeron canadensis TaxID=72917 RepID=UPI001CB896BD|nr:eukaryotic translation initiation factor 2 subunit beta-like [Erigeron canadensis]XP_043622086.1 eukaryotic translation initiation factor 2 subunit beta-like [Erigeron canadensis]
MAEEKDQMLVIKEEGEDYVANVAACDPSKKKKKKKVVIQDTAEDLEQIVEKTESLSVSDSLEPTFTGLKKKKKRQTDLLDSDKENVRDNMDDSIVENDEEGEGKVLEQHRLPWEGTDLDYEYEELISRAFNTLREINPRLAGDRRKTIMKPPYILREGTKKTVFVNFTEICKSLHREPEHAMSFLLTELGTTGSIDGQQRLTIKGRFLPSSFERLLKRYCNNYVICNVCKSSETNITKENRLSFIQCDTCGSRRSVDPIKDGFKACLKKRGNSRK